MYTFTCVCECGVCVCVCHVCVCAIAPPLFASEVSAGGVRDARGYLPPCHWVQAGTATSEAVWQDCGVGLCPTATRAGRTIFCGLPHRKAEIW
jgi:hypothetical protein